MNIRSGGAVPIADREKLNLTEDSPGEVQKSLSLCGGVNGSINLPPICCRVGEW